MTMLFMCALRTKIMGFPNDYTSSSLFFGMSKNGLNIQQKAVIFCMKITDSLAIYGIAALPSISG